MNKSHPTARIGTRARSSVAAARARQSLLELNETDELDDIQGPRMAAILDDDEDWTEAETEATDINLLLHGYR